MQRLKYEEKTQSMKRYKKVLDSYLYINGLFLESKTKRKMFWTY